MAFGAILLARGIHTLTPIPPGLTERDVVDAALRAAQGPVENRLGLPDRPEKARVYVILEAFVRDHVRRVAEGVDGPSDQPLLSAGSLVISKSAIPSEGIRQVWLGWAVSRGSVFGLHRANLPIRCLEGVAARLQPHFASPHTGDDSDLAFLLAYFCQALDIVPTTQVAATGAFAPGGDHVLFEPRIESILDAARRDRMAHVLFPAANGAPATARPDDPHHVIRRWPVSDARTGVFALLSALAR